MSNIAPDEIIKTYKTLEVSQEGAQEIFNEIHAHILKMPVIDTLHIYKIMKMLNRSTFTYFWKNSPQTEEAIKHCYNYIIREDSDPERIEYDNEIFKKYGVKYEQN